MDSPQEVWVSRRVASDFRLARDVIGYLEEGHCEKNDVLSASLIVQLWKIQASSAWFSVLSAHMQSLSVAAQEDALSA
jgi:hypothetical protein